VTKVNTPHWEGGLGCRDPVKMARGDRRKYKITAKQQQQRQQAHKQKKES